MSDSYGWIKLYRSLQDNEIWQNDEPFDIRSAWVDLLLLANHEEGTVLEGRNPKAIYRGQHKTSYTKLAKRWHWSRDRVKRFFCMLVKLKMVTTYATTNGLTVTVENYAFYQDVPSTDKSTDKSTGKSKRKSSSKSTDNTQTRSKEYKEVKEDKNNNRLPPGMRNPEDEEWQ